MANPIDFYFDFSSPYGYFASTGIDQLAAKYGREVNWHPVLLGVVFKTTGAAPLTMVPIKGEYSKRDFERSAKLHGIAYKLPPQFPIASQAPSRAMLWIGETLGKAKAVEFAKAAYRAFFVDGINISDQDRTADIAAAFGIDRGTLIDAINGAAIKEKLKTEVEQAMAHGVFGSPFMIVDGEPFWGFDRFDQLEAFLKNEKAF